MRQPSYVSLGPKIKQYLELRRSLGFIYRTVEYTLNAFDKHLAQHFPRNKTITREIFIHYLNSIQHLQSKTKHDHVSKLRQFFRFMFQFDSNIYIPEKNLIGTARVQVKPHIFTEDEIIKLIEQAKKLSAKHALLPYTYAMIIGLLWVTGMRIGEVVNLKIEDVDTVNGLLYIRQTKFFKSRLIPLSATSIDALANYIKQRKSFGYCEEPGTSFFFNNRGKPCITATTPRTIKALMVKADLKTVHGKIPRVHDIRHTFATRWLQEFYQSGKDPTAYLPVLATYMGHANIANTQVYLHPSIELLNTAGQQLQSYTQFFLGENYETN